MDPCHWHSQRSSHITVRVACSHRPRCKQLQHADTRIGMQHWLTDTNNTDTSELQTRKHNSSCHSANGMQAKPMPPPRVVHASLQAIVMSCHIHGTDAMAWMPWNHPPHRPSLIPTLTRSIQQHIPSTIILLLSTALEAPTLEQKTRARCMTCLQQTACYRHACSQADASSA